MARVIRVTNVPDGQHRQIKARAEVEGMSMSQYILREVGGSQEGPSLREVLARIAAQPERRLTRPAAELVREARESPAQPQASRNLDSWNGSLHS